PAMRRAWRARGSGAIHEDEQTAGLGVHVLVHGPGAGNARPARPKAPSRLDELALEDVEELRPFVTVDRKAGTGPAADALHPPAAGGRTVLPQDPGPLGRGPPRETVRAHELEARRSMRAHRPLLRSLRSCALRVSGITPR